MPGDGGLTVVGKDLDQALVDEDAQGEILALFKLKRGVDIADI